MRNYKYNELKAALAICVVCIIALLAVCAAALILPDFFNLGLIAVIGGSIGVLLTASIAMLYFRIRRELRFFASLIANFNDIGFIRYNTKKQKAVAHGKIEDITGVAPSGSTMKKQDYDKLLDELYLREHDFEDNVYSSVDGGKWYRLDSYESNNMVCTTIRDVTEYVEKTGIINNLSFYDSLTGLLNKQALTDMLKRKIEHGYRSLAIVHFAIIGMERIVSFEGAEAADKIMEKLAGSVKSFVNSKSIIAGRTGNIGITVILTEGDHEFEDYYEMVKAIFASVTGAIGEISDSYRQYVKIFCGYAIHRGLETDAEKMLAAAQFAAFDAHKRNALEPVRYDLASYKKSEGEFNKLRIFNEIISEELIDYHFQPIVSARTGDIYGYEALMRPHEIDSVRLTPLDVTAIADENNVLERVESITFSMTLKILSENQEVFQDKRLFINSVSCVTLAESEYTELVDAYSELFPKLTIEITEANKISKDIMPALNKYFKPYRTHVALDDYGAGYSNDKTLLEILPNYIKIDRSLIMDIDKDDKKKQLVSNIISFAESHGVYSLAEGVETEQELETVIFLGVDLIQGYFTCRPVPIFMHEIDGEIKNLIVKYSIMHANRDDKVFEVKDDTPVDIVNLSAFGYTNIVVRHDNVSFFGDADATTQMHIICPDDYDITMRFKDVNIHSDDCPAVEIGRYSSFTLYVEGENTLSNQGIRIPETSDFTLEGGGNLNINGSFVDSVCLGSNSTQGFGRINLNGTGQLNITNKCDKCVCIGGRTGSAESVITVNSGRISLNSRGVDALGIGAHEGDAAIILNNCYISADVSGTNAVAIGSINGCADIRSSADMSLIGTGNNCCLIGSQYGGKAGISLNGGIVDINASGMSIVGIGVTDGAVEFYSKADLTITSSGDDCALVGSHNGKSGKISFGGGSNKFTCNAKRITAIGSLSGQCDIELISGLFDILCEGNNAICIGNLEGGGDIVFDDVIINAIDNSSKDRSIATQSGKITISGGNIYTNTSQPLSAFSPYGSSLTCQKIETTDESVEREVTDGISSYTYKAKKSPLFEGFYLYLPE